MVTTIRIGTFFGATAVISADGRYMVFVSALDELDNPNDNNGADDVVLQELATGELTYVSVSDDEVVGNRGSAFLDSIAISADGRFVTFASDATNLVDTDNLIDFDIFVRDRQNETTIMASINSQGEKGGGTSENETSLKSDAFDPVMSPDGRYVVFRSIDILHGLKHRGFQV